MEQRRGLQILPFERERYERVLVEHLADPEFRAASEAGRTLAEDGAVREALSRE
ncbi:MAG: hypothetical protein ACJ750_10660 [Gaiellaceae bacterium]